MQFRQILDLSFSVMKNCVALAFRSQLGMTCQKTEIEMILKRMAEFL